MNYSDVIETLVDMGFEACAENTFVNRIFYVQLHADSVTMCRVGMHDDITVLHKGEDASTMNLRISELMDDGFEEVLRRRGFTALHDPMRWRNDDGVVVFLGGYFNDDEHQRKVGITSPNRTGVSSVFTAAAMAAELDRAMKRSRR